MSIRVQVILQREEAEKFRSQASRESKSLSAWLRDAAFRAFEKSQETSALTTLAALEGFFSSCNKREEGREPEWDDYKKMVLQSKRGAQLP